MSGPPVHVQSQHVLVGGRLYVAEVRESVFTEQPDSPLCDVPFIAIT